MKQTTRPTLTERPPSAIAMIARCLRHQNPEIPVPVVSPTLIEAIPDGFNREGVLPEAWGSVPDVVLSEGVEGV